MSNLIKGQNAASKEWIKTLHNNFVSNLNGCINCPISQFRKNEYKKLEEEAFPSRRDEDWKYTNFNRELNKPYTLGTDTGAGELWMDYTFDELNAYHMVFVNGVFSEEYSQIPIEKGLQLIPISKAMEDPDFSNSIFRLSEISMGTMPDTFLTFNKAFAHQGLFLKVKKGANLSKPLFFIYINDGNSTTRHISFPRVIVDVDDQARVTILEAYHSTKEGLEYFTNSSSTLSLGRGALMNYYRLQFESSNASHVNTINVLQGGDSQFNHYAVDFGGRKVRNNLAVLHQERGCETNFSGVYIAREGQHIDNQTFVDHAMPDCNSNELYKGIISDSAKGVFNGKVIVRRNAQRINAFQANNSIVLSENAKMYSKPQLEIYADDVKCSHGATIGQLDESSLFYLESRGLSRQAAKNLLQKGFVGEVVTGFTLHPVRDKILDLIDDKLS